jgi:hypothetical protein
MNKGREELLTVAKEALLASAAGTSAFTAFSYLAACLFNKKFKEPKLLGTMIDRLDAEMDSKESQLSGWVLHYATGILFVLIYQRIVKENNTPVTIGNGAVAGLLSAAPASLIWHIALEAHPSPPRKSSLAYYTQLAIGHAIFGAVSFAVLRYLKKASAHSLA